MEMKNNRGGTWKGAASRWSNHFGFWVDQILVLKDGRVREVGTFDELSKKNGVFQSMLRQKKTT